jgi:hypothetical protein
VRRSYREVQGRAQQLGASAIAVAGRHLAAEARLQVPRLELEHLLEQRARVVGVASAVVSVGASHSRACALATSASNSLRALASLWNCSRVLRSYFATSLPNSVTAWICAALEVPSVR